MTATTMTSSGAPTTGLPSHRSPVTRIRKAVRLHLTNPYTILVLPWLILIGILLVNVAIWIIIHIASGPDGIEKAEKGLQYSGSAFYPFVYFFVVAVQAINVTFSLALGYGMTRRNYYVGTAVTFVGLAAVYAIGMALLGVIEQLTGGWFLGGHMFTSIYFGENWWTRLLVFFFGLLFCLFTGSGFAAVWVRWKANGLIIAFATLAALIIAAIAVFTLTGTWLVIGGAVLDNGPLVLTAWLLIPAAISAIAGFFILRRATPRS